MTRTRDVETFDPGLHRETLSVMSARREGAHDRGRETLRSTGQLNPDVDIKGKIRRSRNAMIRQEGTELLCLQEGPKWSGAFKVDGTASMGRNLEIALKQMELIFSMLEFLRGRRQTDVSFGICQDVDDFGDVVQMAQFESSNRATDHVRELVPTFDGGDIIEDYDLDLIYTDRFTQLDCFDFYGQKGLYVITGDQIGRGHVTSAGVLRHLGHQIEEQQVDTRDICRSLLTRWNPFFVQLGDYGGIKSWWERNLGDGRVIILPDASILAAVWAGLAYVTETAQPNQEEFVSLVNTGNTPLSARKIEQAWDCLQAAKPHFGAQTRLEGYADLPKPGDRFVHLRHAWPAGHAREHENITPPEVVAA